MSSTIHFGSDGKLYVGVGDNANGANAQVTSNLLGKILRLNADGTIPSDNPFYSSASGANRAIWAIGLRNPFTFGVQNATGRIFVNDVGQNTWEEIDDLAAGANYGWPDTEGSTNDARFHTPIHAYSHADGCAITGGAFYDPLAPSFPAAYVGKYFFSDYCGGWIRWLDPATGTVTTFTSGIPSPVDLEIGPADGSLYYLARGTGSVGRISNSAGDAPQITAEPADLRVAAGQSATFAVSASGASPLSYQWKRDGVDLAGEGAPNLVFDARASDDQATFRCVVTNAYGTTTSQGAILTVLPGDLPTAEITSPADGATYAAGDTISYEGSATDPEDGVLNGDAFTWTVELHHDDHTHPFVPPTTGATSGSFVIPTVGETSANVFYRITLTVMDASGLETTVTRDIRPRTATLLLDADPSGLEVTLDGQPATTPLSSLGVVGMTRNVSAVSPQRILGVTYEFVDWSDGGSRTHDVTIGGAGATLVATYREAAGPCAGQFEGEYYGNATLSGEPVFTRCDASINFRWGSGRPSNRLPSNNFSIRWSGRFSFPGGPETFTATADDGIRVWVDDERILDGWYDHRELTFRGTVDLEAGEHRVRVEYYERRSRATAIVSW